MSFVLLVPLLDVVVVFVLPLPVFVCAVVFARLLLPPFDVASLLLLPPPFAVAAVFVVPVPVFVDVALLRLLRLDILEYWPLLLQ